MSAQTQHIPASIQVTKNNDAGGRLVVVPDDVVAACDGDQRRGGPPTWRARILARLDPRPHPHRDGARSPRVPLGRPAAGAPRRERGEERCLSGAGSPNSRCRLRSAWRRRRGLVRRHGTLTSCTCFLLIYRCARQCRFHPGIVLPFFPSPPHCTTGFTGPSGRDASSSPLHARRVESLAGSA